MVLLSMFRGELQEFCFGFGSNLFGAIHSQVPTTQHFRHHSLLVHLVKLRPFYHQVMKILAHFLDMIRKSCGIIQRNG